MVGAANIVNMGNVYVYHIKTNRKRKTAAQLIAYTQQSEKNRKHKRECESGGGGGALFLCDVWLPDVCCIVQCVFDVSQRLIWMRIYEMLLLFVRY